MNNRYTLLISALLVGLCAAAVCPVYVNHDAAWYLHAAAVWLDGGTLYRDVVDTNPPLIIFLTAVPSWVAGVLHVSAPAVFKAFVLLGAGLTTIVSIPLIRRIVETESSRSLLVILLAFLLFPFVKSDFGQREHFTVLLTVPFVLATAAWAGGRPAGGRAGAAAGVAAGLGFAMKPHFLLAWLAVELCLVVTRPRPRSWMRPAAIGVFATVVAYGALVILFVPDYLTVAREVAQVYGGLNSPSAVLLRLPDVQIWIVAAITLAVLRLAPAQRSSCIVVFAAATGFLLAAILQLKGWSYHLYPFRVFVAFFFGTSLVALADTHPAALDVIRGGRRILNAAALAAMTLWSVRYVAEAWRPVGVDLVTPLVALQRQTGAESMAVLTMRAIVYPAFPVVNYTHATWVLRHHSLWFLPGLYDAELTIADGEPAFRRREDLPALERKYYEEVIEDLCARPPRLLIVEPPIAHAPVGRRALDLIAYYRQDPRFARLFTSYAPVATVGSFVAYSRTGAASCGGA